MTNNTLNTSDNPSSLVTISAADNVNDSVLTECYTEAHVQTVLTTTLSYINSKVKNGISLPYFTEISFKEWASKPKALEIYITDGVEGRALNLEARGKDYATNILSYPSDLPAFILAEMPEIPLGELVICHEVVEREADEQGKTVSDHVTHLLVHGILHLLGFDHELGQAEQDEMEGFEVEILGEMGVGNPYDAN